MYARHFGLQHEPFSIAPDPRFLFMSQRHREALAHLIYGLAGGGGFVLLTGEIGAGKTTVCRAFLEQVPAGTHVAYIFNPKLTAPELLQTVCDEFGLAVCGPGMKARVDALNAYLLRTHAAGENSVLVIDEAQSLSAEVLEQLRLLTNLETSERKLLQIILIGQPELRQMLARPELEQLAQRVIARWHLGPLDEAETMQYVRHRLAVAGASGPPPFRAKALRQLHALAGGVPRRINLLADRALLGAYGAGLARVGPEMVEQAAREVFDDRRPVRGRHALVAGGALLLVASALGTAWLVGRQSGSGAPAAARMASAPVLAGGAASGVPVAATAASPAATGPESAASATSAASAAIAARATSATVVAASAAPAAAPEMAASTAAALPTLTWPERPGAADDALRDLALLWSATLPAGAACEVAPAAQLQCFRSPSLTLATIRALDRPGLVTLQRASAPSLPALLLAVDDGAVTVQVGGARATMTRAEFGSAWRGDFTTFWRLPSAGAAASPQWIGERLAALGSAAASAPLPSRIQAFQRTHGLVADGVPGSLTLMQLNRALGVPEPRLSLQPTSHAGGRP